MVIIDLFILPHSLIVVQGVEVGKLSKCIEVFNKYSLVLERVEEPPFSGVEEVMRLSLRILSNFVEPGVNIPIYGIDVLVVFKFKGEGFKLEGEIGVDFLDLFLYEFMDELL